MVKNIKIRLGLGYLLAGFKSSVVVEVERYQSLNAPITAVATLPVDKPRASLSFIERLQN